MAAVPPAVVNAHADALLNVANQGDHPNSADIRAGRAAKRRKRAADLSAVGESRRRSSANNMFAPPQATAALPSGAAIPGAPAWFGPAMAVTLAPLQATLNHIEARQHNSQAMHAGGPIHPITDSAGNVPPLFLADVRALKNLNQNERRGLLVFYELPPNPWTTCESRLRHFLGLPHC